MSSSPTRLPIDARLVGRELSPLRWSWDERDTMLYALGVGATVEEDLDVLYEGRGPAVLATFGVIPSTLFLEASMEIVDFDLSHLLHAGQSLELFRPLPPRGEVTTTRRITNVWDKGSAAIIEWESISSEDAGPLARSTATTFHLGAGGFGGDRGPIAVPARPERDPDHVLHQTTSPDQAALYRLSGDRNPIHIDPAFARASGYERPFMHGLCTFGIIGRVLAHLPGPDVGAELRTLDARFRGLVYPGESLRIEVWNTGPGEVAFEAFTTRGVVVSGGRAAFGEAIGGITHPLPGVQPTV